MHEDEPGPQTIRRSSGRVRCPRLGVAGIVSAVERDAGGRCLRSIVWCSLRDHDQRCAENCLPPLAAGEPDI